MSIPSEVVRCVRHGIVPKEQEGMDWCASADCEQCEGAVWSELLRERDRLKAERDRALAELDKALGEREDAMLSERNAAYNAGFDEGFASADDWYAEHAAELAEHGWARLPRDMDGEYIRIGDVMEWPDGKTFEVAGIGDGVLFYAEDEDGLAEWTGASTNRHHHAPTVEDTLREFIDKWLSTPHDSERELFAEYAAKLRELVRDAWGNGHPDRSCESCDIRDECHDDIERMRKDGVLRFSRCLFELRIEERMRELGVEVD